MPKKNRTTQINVTFASGQEDILTLFDVMCDEMNTSRSELIVTLMANEVGLYTAEIDKQTKDLLADLKDTEAGNDHLPEFLL